MSMPSSIPFQKKNLSEVSTFLIGGECPYFVEVRTVELLQQVFQFIRDTHLPYYILGKGSNTIFDDRGFYGVVILNKLDQFFMEENEVRVGSGYSFSLLGTRLSRQGLSGLEFASGIPGTVGGAVFMNAGAGGQETKDPLVDVDYLHLSGERSTYLKNDLQFAYRHSPFQDHKGMIIAARFKLTPSPSAKQDQRALIEYRMKTQPYKDPSAGCIFRNPLEGSAGALIDQCKLKGLRVGGAEVSSLHANFIVNVGQATQQDVLDLAKKVQQEVAHITGVHLSLEARFIDVEGHCLN